MRSDSSSAVMDGVTDDDYMAGAVSSTSTLQDGTDFRGERAIHQISNFGPANALCIVVDRIPVSAEYSAE
jgi:hypothetical protein